MRQTIRFYLSFRSPFAGIALHRVMGSPDFADVDFQLIPVWPDIIFGGHMDNPSDNLFKLVYIFQDAARQADVAGLNSDYLKQLSAQFVLPESVDYHREKVGVKLGEEQWEIPHAALLYAQQHGKEWAFAEAVFARRFGFDGQPVANVMDPDVVSKIAEQIGLDGQLAANAHRSPAVIDGIRAIERQGEADGVFGVPFFVVEREAIKESFWGNDHLEYLLRSIRGCGDLPVLTTAGS